MFTITSKYAPYKGAFRVFPEGRQWLNPETQKPEFADYDEAYRAVRTYLLNECDWSPTPEENGGFGGLMPEGHDRSWFDFGERYVNADGEEISITEA
jgi:hypothetical protein